MHDASGIGCASAVQLNPEQQRVLDAIASGFNVFLTGPAGTGKTVTLRAAIHHARHTLGKHIGVTAATGSAALLIQGRTLHSFLGIGLGKKSAAILAQNMLAMARMRPTVEKLRHLDLLVIDEISMIHAELLTLIDEYLRRIRLCVEKPFGGVQVLFCGDFCQLPPVEGSYAFKAPVWKTLQLTYMELTLQMRQNDDSAFQELLQRLRQGRCHETDLALLKVREKTEFPIGIRPTRMYAINRDVDAINQRELKQLLERPDAVAQHFPTIYTRYQGDKEHVIQWAEACGIPGNGIKLAVGAQVVLTINLSQELGRINGSRGRVVGFDSGTAGHGPAVTVEWVDGTTSLVGYHEIDTRGETTTTSDVRVRYIPLRLAWAITIHRAQGMTLDAVEMDLGPSIFEYGQAYTALSRARNLKSIRITAVQAKAFRTHPDVSAFYNLKF